MNEILSSSSGWLQVGHVFSASKDGNLIEKRSRLFIFILVSFGPLLSSAGYCHFCVSTCSLVDAHGLQ